MLRQAQLSRLAVSRTSVAAWARRGAASTKAGTWIDSPVTLETNLVHAAVEPDITSGAILTPLFLSTTFVQDSVQDYLKKGYSYSRTNNPTTTALEKKLAAVEGGVGACAFGTGMAATTAAISATMKAGDHCVITECSYGGTNRSCREFFTPLGMEFTFSGGAFHCPLMKPAADELEQALDRLLPKMQPPRCHIYFNLTGKKTPPGTDPAAFLDL